MLTRDRLRTTPEIRAVFAARSAVGSALLVVHGAPRPTPGPGRFAVVAGRRVGGAVQRNRAKRRLRAALATLPLPDGLDLVLTAKPAILDAPFDRVVADVHRGLNRLGASHQVEVA